MGHFARERRCPSASHVFCSLEEGYRAGGSGKKSNSHRVGVLTAEAAAATHFGCWAHYGISFHHHHTIKNQPPNLL